MSKNNADNKKLQRRILFHLDHAKGIIQERDEFLVRLSSFEFGYESANFNFLRMCGYVVTLHEDDYSWHITLPEPRLI